MLEVFMRWSFVAVVVVTVAVPGSAHAALDDVLATAGGSVSEVVVGTQTLRVRQRGTVREYSDETGRVFAITWAGHFAPPLVELLGPYKDEYELGMRTRRHAGHNRLVLHTSRLAISASSHGRWFMGHLVLTDRVPKGVTVDALR